MDHTKLHPLVRMLVEAYARECGIEPDRQWRWLEGREVPPPRWVKQQLYNFDPGLKESDFRLTSPHEAATLATMPQVESTSRQQKVSRAMLDPENRKHPLVKALVKERLTVTQLAKELGYPRSSVQSWYDENNPRPIPKAAALKIEKRFDIPLTSWRRVVT